MGEDVKTWILIIAGLWVAVGSIVVLRTESRLTGVPIREFGRMPSEKGVLLRYSSRAMIFIWIWPICFLLYPPDDETPTS